MAVVAGVTTGNVVGVLTNGRRTVMAARTGPQHLEVIHPHNGCKRDDRMAVLTDISGKDMVRVLTYRLHTVMAADAVANDIHVIKVRGQPTIAGVAIVAGVATGNVAGILAGRRGAVLTAGTGAQDLEMIDAGDGAEGDRRVTVFADVGGGDMSEVFAGCLDTIVAAVAVARNAPVVETSRQPGHCGVAVIALITGARVGRGLALLVHIVMAGGAATEYRVMVHLGDRHPARRAMAILTEVCAEYMICWLGAGRYPAALSVAGGTV